MGKSLSGIVITVLMLVSVWAGAHTLDPSSEQIEATNESDNPIDGPKINLIQEGPTGLIVEVYDITCFCDIQFRALHIEP